MTVIAIERIGQESLGLSEPSATSQWHVIREMVEPGDGSEVHRFILGSGRVSIGGVLEVPDDLMADQPICIGNGYCTPRAAYADVGRAFVERGRASVTTGQPRHLSGRSEPITALAETSSAVADYARGVMGVDKVNAVIHSLHNMVGIRAGNDHPERYDTMVSVAGAALVKDWLLPVRFLGSLAQEGIPYLLRHPRVAWSAQSIFLSNGIVAGLQARAVFGGDVHEDIPRLQSNGVRFAILRPSNDWIFPHSHDPDALKRSADHYDVLRFAKAGHFILQNYPVESAAAIIEVIDKVKQLNLPKDQVLVQPLNALGAS